MLQYHFNHTDICSGILASYTKIQTEALIFVSFTQQCKQKNIHYSNYIKTILQHFKR